MTRYRIMTYNEGHGTFDLNNWFLSIWPPYAPTFSNPSERHRNRSRRNLVGVFVLGWVRTFGFGSVIVVVVGRGGGESTQRITSPGDGTASLHCRGLA